MNIISYIGSIFSSEMKRLRNENRALTGKLAHARRQADPVHEVNARHIASLQAKLHEHREAYDGLRKLLAYIYKTKDAEIATLMDGMEEAWGIIANAGGGNWETQTKEWQEAAANWRDEEWHTAIARNVRRRQAGPTTGGVSGVV